MSTRWDNLSTEERFLRLVVPEPTSGCWLWIGSEKAKGYGGFRIDADRGVIRAHRAAYEIFVGPIPEGSEIDHGCRVRCCVNPQHLEPVTHLVNVQRGSRAMATHCKRGHEFTPENTYQQHGKYRSCRACHNVRTLAEYHAKRAATGR